MILFSSFYWMTGVIIALMDINCARQLCSLKNPACDYMILK